MKRINKILIAALALCAAFTIGVPPASATPAEPDVSVVSAYLANSSHVAGESRIDSSGDIITADLGEFEMPGAWAEIAVTVRNTGGRTIYLAGVERTEPTLADFEMRLPELQVGAETLESGEECSFTVVVTRREDSERSVEESGSFGFRLIYTCDESGTQPADTPKTGDESNVFLWSVAALCAAIGAILCISDLRNRD